MYRLSMNQIIEVTDRAKEQIQKIFSSEGPEVGSGLRIGVVGGGCSGLSYKIEFGAPRDKDNIIELSQVNILIDPKSSIYLKGTTLDFQDGLEGKGFVFNNPTAKNTCGCGESFSV
jgi:iron-sulfur cluster assembly protein